MKKQLIFEGCGMDYETTDLSDVCNYRIRTTFLNDKGRLIYLELGGHKNTGNLINRIQHLKFPYHISHCFDLRYKKTNSDPKLRKLEHSYGEYTKKNILRFVNDNLDCSFDEIIIDSSHDGFMFKAKFKDDYNGCFKEYAGKEVTISEVIPCDEGDADYWFKVKDIDESHLIKSKHFIGMNC